VKLLLDGCVWGGAVDELRTAGHDAEWSGSWERDPGDVEILRRAHAAGCVLVTLDKDFGEIAVVHGTAHSGIVRLVDFRAREQARACLGVIERFGAELAKGAIVTASPDRVRIRPAEA
jgi:predicted nuclease of predicted toxin-antitoxin system